LSLSIVIPWQDRGALDRRRIAEFVIAHYRSLDIGEVVIGTYDNDGQTLNLSRLRNEGASLASGDVLVFIDADVLLPTEQILEAARLASEAPGAVLTYSHFLTDAPRDKIDSILDGEDWQKYIDPARPHYLYNGPLIEDWHVGSSFAVSRYTYERVGPWDEDFVGWGEEDKDYLVRSKDMFGPLRFAEGGMLHLGFHMNDADHGPALIPGTPENIEFMKNRERFLAKRKERPLKIAVYAPAKNEAHNIEEWAKSAKGADEIVLLDTGSTDGTLELAKKHRGIKAHQAVISPWRFDDGMNAALWHVSPDIDVAICLHLDDRLEPGWREEIEKAGLAGQYTFNYKWSDELTYRHDRIHARHGYRWTGAAHEALDGPGPKVNTDLWMTQHRDLSKDRSQDPDLIHLAYRENKTPRTTYYSAREHYYKDEWGPAREKFLEYLAMPGATYDQERAEACRIMARMVWPAQKEAWLLKACAEAPQRREPWAELALMYKEQGRNMEASGAAARAMSIRERTPENSFHCEDFAWSDEILGALLLF
jgi:glycosyltransferase involved in cell wall biosynthesis